MVKENKEAVIKEARELKKEKLYKCIVYNNDHDVDIPYFFVNANGVPIKGRFEEEVILSESAIRVLEDVKYPYHKKKQIKHLGEVKVLTERIMKPRFIVKIIEEIK